ncbi:MAG: hypothetical protein LQ352_007618 [Teloschistes flavicans]|nr:MAG: hypothetical protein LQ352_007618 [Teloschistes flavicans]
MEQVDPYFLSGWEVSSRLVIPIPEPTPNLDKPVYHHPASLLSSYLAKQSGLVSKARLLTLPLELLALILHHIPKTSLASLALVNSDCRQLARPFQFASIHFDHSTKIAPLLEHLQQEIDQRAVNDEAPAASALDSCVRSLKICTKAASVRDRHGIDQTPYYRKILGRWAGVDYEESELSDDGVIDLSEEEERSRRLVRAYQAYSGPYFNAILNLLSEPDVLPHLECLDWQDEMILQPCFLDTLRGTTVRHLRLSHVLIDRSCTTRLCKTLRSIPWPLRSLALYRNYMSESQTLAWSRICLSLLRACAPTLETLELADEDANQSYLETDNLGPIPCFPSLRHLNIEAMAFNDHSLVRELLHDGLTSLRIGSKYYINVTAGFIGERGQIRALESMTWTKFDGFDSPLMEFFRANTHLREVIFHQYPSDQNILPTLMESFKDLRSLSIKLTEKEISAREIKTISKITTLERLHIGNDVWWYGWNVNHDSICSRLSDLPSLKALFFINDRYPDDERPVYRRDARSDLYYREREPPFEEHHWNRVSADANRYAGAMPQLKYLYLGQYPMAIQSNQRLGRTVIKRLTAGRTKDGEVLKGLFGRDTIDPTEWSP